jgi:hypothetical protein
MQALATMPREKIYILMHIIMKLQNTKKKKKKEPKRLKGGKQVTHEKLRIRMALYL